MLLMYFWQASAAPREPKAPIVMNVPGRLLGVEHNWLREWLTKGARAVSFGTATLNLSKEPDHQCSRRIHRIARVVPSSEDLEY
jgi:hypothetical protein